MSPSSQTKNDAELWAEWGRQHWRAVWGYLWGMVRNRDSADELTQEVFVRAWKAREAYREQGTARAYLLRIADHLVIDRHRKSGREINVSEETWRQIEPVSRADGIEDVVERAEISAQLASTLDRLSPAQRRVLLLRYYGDLPFAEIAEVMESPIGTVLSHCRRGLLTLRSLLVEAEE